MISGPPLEGNSNELCDWLELAALAKPDRRVLLNEINQGSEIDQDFESTDFADEDEACEQRVQRVLEAVDERKSAMPTAYPFRVNAEYLELVEPGEITDGGATYLFCLVVSNAAKNGLLYPEGPWQPNLPLARNLFQACATVCAAGWARGPSFSVGWPRPDAPSFLAKLKQVYQRFGDGKPHDSRPAWAPDQVKDDEIDVISFKQELDGRPGTLYLLTQAATGANWKDKSVKNAIKLFHDTWFHQPPASHADPALAFPFCLTRPIDGVDHESQERIRGLFWRTANKMGHLLYRHRVAHYVDEGVKLAGAGVAPIEQVESLALVRKYVDDYIPQLQAAVQGLA